MTNDFGAHLAKSRRLTLLRLMRDNAGSANESVLHTAVIGLGFPKTSRDDVRADLEWLKERRLVTIEEFAKPTGGIIMIGTITARGVDAAAGRGEAIEGLARSEYPE